MEKKRYDNWLNKLKLNQEIRIQKYIENDSSYESQWQFIKGNIKSKNTVSNLECLQEDEIKFNPDTGVLVCPYNVFPLRIVPISYKFNFNSYFSLPLFEPLWNYRNFLLIVHGSINISDLVKIIKNEFPTIILDGIIIQEGLLVQVFSDKKTIISFIEYTSNKQILHVFSEKLKFLYS